MNTLSCAEINKAVDLLNAGALVSFPTETVYALGGDAQNPHAIQRIYQLKKRPLASPLSVLIKDIKELEKWAAPGPSAMWALAEKFWPGPLTLIVKKNSNIISNVMVGGNNVGLRVPNHPIAAQLLAVFGRGIAAPSANRSGCLSPTSAIHVREEFGSKVDLIIDGGVSALGIESSIVDFSGDSPCLLRQGAIPREALEEVLKQPLLLAETPSKNYNIPMSIQLVSAQELDGLKDLWMSAESRAVLSYSMDFSPLRDSIIWIKMPLEAKDYGQVLYSSLRSLVSKNCHKVFIEAPPHDTSWKGIYGVLKKIIKE